ncbi:MAG: Ig-like domain-containing protein [Bacteroidales bacterium]|nr:Ig-like domain-containing protein [Bacteroidales bacterium]
MLKKLIDKYLPLIPATLILGVMVFSHSCANTTQAPSGGLKDTIPPVISKISPLPGTVMVPVHDTKIVFSFNEYIQVKNPKNIYLSPPQKKAPKYKISGKSLVVYFEDDLEPNTTYTLDLTDAIADNNEGNMYPGYTYVFSTGEKISDRYITGTVQDCNTLMPVKGATVMLYKDHADSALFLHRPTASAKTDEWGFFCIRNVEDTLFRLYAMMDDANDNIFDQNADKIAFIDSLVRPKNVVNDTIFELMKFDMKDTVNCMLRHSEYELNLFRDKSTKQFLKNKERVDERSAYITFQAENAQIDSLWIKGLSSKRIITQFNIYRDSLEIWVNDSRPIPDTLHLFTKYWKSDSVGVLRPHTEEARLVNPNKKSLSKSSRRDIKHEDTICVVKLEVKPETVEQYGFDMIFKYPPVYEAFDSLQFRIVNPRQRESFGKVTVTRDSLNLRHYIVKPVDKLLHGYEYYLKVPHRKFEDINGFWNDSTEVKVSLPNDEKLSTLNLEITGVENRYIVELLGEKRDKVIRSFVVDNDQTVTFPYLSSGKYTIRITEDRNKNGLVDSGSLLDHRQPEKVKFYKIKDNYQIQIMERAEITQSINITELFEN